MTAFPWRRFAFSRSEDPAVESSEKAKAIFEREHRRICMRTDKLIAFLMLLQWPGAILASLLVSAKTWDGGASRIHPHVVTAIGLGGLVTVLPVALAIFEPGKVYTRHVIAACQMLMSGLLIHITGGRIDLALYKVKKNGRNSLLVFDETMRAETMLQMSLEHQLRAAVRDQLMEVYYQPIVDVIGQVLGFEALLRWNDPVHGQVSPDQFIPIAERTGLIIPLGNWVLAQACGQAAAWRRQGNQIMKMSVNVSSTQLSHEKFVSVVLATLRETGLPAEVLDLELTEGVMVENHGQTSRTLELLRKFGVRLSIDDFGTGYSSLSYLRELPVHTLKIDRAFVRDIECSKEARLLVEGMIDMARSLNLRIVAEGVENREQMDILIAAGCDQIQGFHISRAVPAEDAERLMLGAESRTKDEPEGLGRFAKLPAR